MSNEKKIYCRDCGTELQARIHTQMVEPYHSHLYFYCTGKCHIERCAAQGDDPAMISSGTPKCYVLLSEKEESREQIDLKAEAIILILKHELEQKPIPEEAVNILAALDKERGLKVG